MKAHSIFDLESLTEWWGFKFRALFAFIRWAFDLRRGAAGDYADLALKSYRNSNPEAARTYYQMAIRRKPDDADFHAQLGQVYFEDGELDDAERYFRRALEIDHKNLRALKGLAFVLHDKGETEALYTYLKYLEVDATDPDILINVGVILANDARHEEALSYFTRAEEVAPDSVAVHSLQGQSLFALQRFQQAIESFKCALELAPDDASLHRLIAYSLEANGDGDASQNHFRRSIELAPDEPSSYFSLSVLLDRLEHYDEAVFYAEKAAELYELSQDDIGAAEAYWELGWLLYLLERYKESIAANRSALEKDAALFEVHFNLALALLHDGNPDKARQEYELGISKLTDFRDLSVAAIDDLREALQKNPALKGGQEILAFLEKQLENGARRNATLS